LVHLLVAGTGPVEAELRSRAPESVTFLGNLDRQRRLPDLYASADAFVFASVTETLGLVVLEAMASGLPVVAVAAGGVVDNLRDGRNGLAVAEGSLTRMTDDLTARMVELVRNPGLRQALALEARRTAETRSWQAELDRLEESYREVCTAWRREPTAQNRGSLGAASVRRRPAAAGANIAR
jgi:glycosyltransferase involved in cell wall biosynthesis